MGFEVVIGINATEERVWAALTDVEHWPDWTSSVTSVARIDGGSFGVGSQARIKQPKLGTMHWTVTELTLATRCLGGEASWFDTCRGPLPQLGRWCDREPQAHGGTEGSGWSAV